MDFEIKKDAEKPSFEEWMDTIMCAQEGSVIIRSNTLYYGLRANMDIYRGALCNLAKNSGVFKEEDPEFEKLQKEWFHLYQRVIILRSFAIHFYGLPMPGIDDIMPERLYCGTLMHEEDFKKYMTNTPKGVVKQEPESIDSYKPKKSPLAVTEEEDCPEEEETTDKEEKELLAELDSLMD